MKTLFRIAKDESKEMEQVFTSYFALEGLWNLIVNGTPSERKVMMEAFINEHHAIDYCLQVSFCSTSFIENYNPPSIDCEIWVFRLS